MKKDVKHPFDIPQIEELTDQTFVFDFYEPGDHTFGYSLPTPTNEEIDLYRIVISIQKIPTLLKEEKLSDLITLDNIEYLSFDNCLKNESFHYRPLIPDSEKTF